MNFIAIFFHMKNKKWFTLVELLLAVVIAGTLIGIVMAIYTWIMWADIRMSDKRLLTAEASDIMDMIHTAALDYTIDYEEYFNRRWLSLGVWSTWFTTYWNSWTLYYCWSWFNWEATNTINKIYTWSEGSWWCLSWWNQKYLEYNFQHWKLATWDLNSKENSWSKEKSGPIAISPNTWLDYLYLINEDWTERYYIRRILTWGNNDLYKLQALRLYWYDAGVNHDFNSTWKYDWFIDTWACDYTQWYKCQWHDVIWWNKLPANYYDWWVDITSNKVTVSDFRVDIFPNVDPYLNKQDENLMDPYAKITIKLNLYGKPSYEEIILSTTLSFKNSYFKFPVEKRRCVPDENGFDNCDCSQDVNGNLICN